AVAVTSWCSWSATVKATATLVSTRSLDLFLAGIAKRAHEVVVDRDARGRDDRPPVLILERVVPGNRLDVQARAVGGDLDLPRTETELVSELLRDDEATCLVDGCSHGQRLPSLGHSPGCSIIPPASARGPEGAIEHPEGGGRG